MLAQPFNQHHMRMEVNISAWLSVSGRIDHKFRQIWLENDQKWSRQKASVNYNLILLKIKESNYNESPFVLNTSFDTKCLISTSANDFHLFSVWGAFFKITLWCHNRCRHFLTCAWFCAWMIFTTCLFL